MTPTQIENIFTARGFFAAEACAKACGEERLIKLVANLQKSHDRRIRLMMKRADERPMRPGKTERDRNSGALKRQEANRQSRGNKSRNRGTGGGKKDQKAA